VVTEQISAGDVRGWNSLDAIADSLTDRGLEQINRSDDQIELAFANDDMACITAVEGDHSSEVALPIDDLTQQFKLVLAAKWDTGRFDLPC
jgi:hypothetical protein